MTDHPAFRSSAADILSWDGHVTRMLAVESAIASAQAGLGIIPRAAGDAIAAACAGRIDREALAASAARAATPVIPLVGMLRDAVGDEHAAFVHFGATSQDVIDTALVLQVRDAARMLLGVLRGIGERSATLAQEHRDTIMVGRTLLQHAVPITFGLKAAHWLAMVGRHVERLSGVVDGLPVQMGGAAGTLAAFGERGVELLEQLADELRLAAPVVPWHTDRDVLHGAVVVVGTAAGSLGKIALDVSLLMQTEVGELVDPGAGGSSTMPQKRNPVDPAFAAAAARLAVGAVGDLLPAAVQEHERAAGTWQLEWVAVPRVLDHTVAAAERVREVLDRIQVDATAMRRNLDATGGAVLAESLVIALAPRIGRRAAADLVAELLELVAAQGSDLATVAAADARVTGALRREELAARLDPSGYLGNSGAFIDRALAAWRELDDGASLR